MTATAMAGDDSTLAPAFIPIAVLPEQFQTDRTLQPEQRLALAVLNDGIVCSFGAGDLLNARQRAREQRSARRWLADLQTDAPYSFVWCCHHLSLDPANLSRLIGNFNPAGITAYRRRRPIRPHKISETRRDRDARKRG